MEARGLAAATVGRRLAALRSVVALAGRLGRCDWELSVDSPKVVPYRDTRGPGRDGWRAIAGRLASGQDRTAVRDLALCRVLHDLMLRRSEVAGLDLTDLEFEGGKPTSVWILGKGKSAKIRLALPARTSDALATWLVVRGVDGGAVFPRLDRSTGPPFLPISAHSVWRIVGRTARRAGVARHVAPHGLRHEGITYVIQRGASLLEAQIIARHADPRTTLKYIDAVNDPQKRLAELNAED